MRKRKESAGALHRPTICKSEGLALSTALHGKASEEVEAKASLAEESTTAALRLTSLRNSRSDGSINESFEVITESEVQASISQQRPMDRETPRQLGLTKKSRHLLKEGTVPLFQPQRRDIRQLPPLFFFSLPGFKWQRQLIFRSKLTMHTAYDRSDNNEPASISAIAISK